MNQMSRTEPLLRRDHVQNQDRATKAAQIINDQSTRLVAIAPSQGTGDEYRISGTSCVAAGVVDLSDPITRNTTLSLTLLTLTITASTLMLGRWHRTNQLIQKLSGQNYTRHAKRTAKATHRLSTHRLSTSSGSLAADGGIMRPDDAPHRRETARVSQTPLSVRRTLFQ